MTHTPLWGVYVHLPWCRVRCPYCAFAVAPLQGTPVPDPTGYTDAVLRQWERLAPHYPGRPATLAFGGGTPSLHPPAELARLIRALAPAAGAEVSLEANPEDVDPAWLDAAQEAGITRLSLGIQTLQAGPARLLARAHTVPVAQEVLSRVAAAGFRSWSVDLIFALPGQTRADLDRDLDAVAASGVPHVSLYGLTAEPGTPYTRAVESGQLTPPDDDAWRGAYDHARTRLSDMGLTQYEISNHARPGHRSVHNEHYWRLRPWAGLGMAAHGRLLDGTRTVVTDDLDDFRADPTAWAEWSRGSPRDQAEELLISCLRHVDGLPLARLAALGFTLPDAVLAGLSAEGLLSRSPASVALTPAGLAVADALVAHLALRLDSAAGDAAGEPPA